MYITTTKKAAYTVAVLVSLIALASCSRHIDAAKEALRSILRDPDSLQVTDVTTRKWELDKGMTHLVVCGMFNAKNGYGGYGFSHRFAYDVKTKRLVTLNKPDPNPVDKDVEWYIKNETYNSNLKKINSMCGKL